MSRGTRPEFDATVPRVQGGEPFLHGQHQAAARPRHHGADLLSHFADTVLARGRIVCEHTPADDIDPMQPLPRWVPDRALAQHRTRDGHQLNFTGTGHDRLESSRSGGTTKSMPTHLSRIHAVGPHPTLGQSQHPAVNSPGSRQITYGGAACVRESLLPPRPPRESRTRQTVLRPPISLRTSTPLR